MKYHRNHKYVYIYIYFSKYLGFSIMHGHMLSFQTTIAFDNPKAYPGIMERILKNFLHKKLPIIVK